MSIAATDAPNATTADADMEAAVNQLLEESGGATAEMEAAELSPSKRARKVCTAMNTGFPQHTPIHRRAYTASGCSYAQAPGAVLPGAKANGLESAAPGPKRSGVVHQVATDSNREQTRANESKREQHRAAQCCAQKGRAH